MKDRIIKLDNETTYYVLEKVKLNEKIYVLLAQYDMQKDIMDTENLIVKELYKENDALKIKEIGTNELASRVTMELINKYRMES
ncbi:MAG: hypothetical protein PUD34_04090 [bacterium]|nr:hypothetical protein [bacterium]